MQGGLLYALKGHGFSRAVTPLRFLSFPAAGRPRGNCSSDSPNTTARPISGRYLVCALALTQLAEGNLRGTSRPGPLACPERTRVVQANHSILPDCPHPVNAAFRPPPHLRLFVIASAARDLLLIFHPSQTPVRRGICSPSVILSEDGENNPRPSRRTPLAT